MIKISKTVSIAVLGWCMAVSSHAHNPEQVTPEFQTLGSIHATSESFSLSEPSETSKTLAMEPDPYDNEEAFGLHEQRKSYQAGGSSEGQMSLVVALLIGLFYYLVGKYKDARP